MKTTGVRERKIGNFSRDQSPNQSLSPDREQAGKLEHVFQTNLFAPACFRQVSLDVMSHEQPNLPAFRLALLDAIERGKGKYTWYQLDRAVVPDFPFSNLHLMPMLGELEAEGLIESIPNEGFPGQPFYRLRAESARRAT